MARKKRLRIYAGPNGSGKTTLAKQLIADGEFKASAFVNADEIELELQEQDYFDFTKYDIKVKQKDLQRFCLTIQKEYRS